MREAQETCCKIHSLLCLCFWLFFLNTSYNYRDNGKNKLLIIIEIEIEGRLKLESVSIKEPKKYAVKGTCITLAPGPYFHDFL